MAHAGSSSSCGCSGSNNSMLKIQVAGAQAANDKIVAAQIEKDRLYRVECEAALDWLRNERVALDGVPRQRTPSQLRWKRLRLLRRQRRQEHWRGMALGNHQPWGLTLVLRRRLSGPSPNRERQHRLPHRRARRAVAAGAPLSTVRLFRVVGSGRMLPVVFLLKIELTLLAWPGVAWHSVA